MPEPIAIWAAHAAQTLLKHQRAADRTLLDEADVAEEAELELTRRDLLQQAVLFGLLNPEDLK